MWCIESERIKQMVALVTVATTVAQLLEANRPET